jgi:DNA-binding CsgD family transcriptional regulator
MLMPARVSSPRFVGRRAELTRLETLWKTVVADEKAATVLVSGEAGVGKTRLVSELVARLERPALVLTGSCIEVVDRAMPFGPLVQALRTLHRTLDEPTLDAVLGSARDDLAMMLPELRTGGRGDAETELGTTALFELLLGVFERLGDRVPTLVVLEDLHWSDRSTRDLFVFLARNLDATRVVLLGTYRSDDLHRRHPLRTALAELDRAGAVERVELARFDRDELRELIGAIVGGDPSTELVDRTYARSDGNAFFAEELIASEDSERDALPDTLREIVLARVDSLSPSARQVLRCAAVVGRHVDHRMLVALVQLPEPLLLEALRDAVLEQVLVADDEGLGYRFRHALMHEAIYDDLLPGDRVALHTRVAELFGEHPDWYSQCFGDHCEGEIASEVACHWTAAHNAPRALAASLDAARASERMYAYNEALAHEERVLSLWPGVPDAEQLTGVRHIDVLRDAATQSDRTGDHFRALAFARAALDEVDVENDPVTAGLLHERIAKSLWITGARGDEVLDECAEAVRLVPDEPSEARASVLATRGQHLMLSGRAGAIEACQEAIAAAQLVGARAIEGHARNSLGSALSGIGRIDEGIEQLHQARAIALETRSWADVARAAVNEGSALRNMARHEDAVRLSLEGAEIAHERGLDHSAGAFLRLNAAESLWALGRWDDIDEQLPEIESTLRTGVDEWRAAERRSLMAAGRGRFDEARAAAERVQRILENRGDDRERLAIDRLYVAIAAWEGDAATAVERALTAAQRPVTDTKMCVDVAVMLVVDGLSVAGPEHVDIARTLADEFDSWITDERWGGGRPGDLAALHAQVAAECSRAEGRGEGAEWTAVADLWAALGMRPREAYAWWRASEAFVGAGDREAASASAARAYQLASASGWAWVRDNVAVLARRARLSIELPDVSVVTPAERLGLTAREIEVLGLVAEGRTNRQIADTLFISTKTASVHVSNILGKLSVANRGEAAAAARRLALV